MNPKSAEIKNLSKYYLSQHIDAFLELDKIIREGPWKTENFLIDLESKWDLSTYLVCDGEIAGYIIASRKEDFIHIHRNVIGAKWNGKGLGSANLKYFLNKKSKNTVVRLKVHHGNSKAINFYLKNDLKILFRENEYEWMEFKPSIQG